MTISYRRRVAAWASSVTGRLPVVKPRVAAAPTDAGAAKDSTEAASRPVGDPPLYARLLRLRHIHPGGLLCFLYFEGAVALAVLLALAELVPWTAIPVLPVTVAVIVKINDFTAGGLSKRDPSKSGRSSGPAQNPATPRITAAPPVMAMPRSPYPPRMVYALEAGPARSTLYGTPVRPDADPIGKPSRGALAPSAVYRSSAALSGRPAIEGPVTRLEHQPYHATGRAETLRRGVPPGAIYRSTSR